MIEGSNFYGESASGTCFLNPAGTIRAVLSAGMRSLLAVLLKARGLCCIERHRVSQRNCIKPMLLHVVPRKIGSKAPCLSLILRVRVFNLLRVAILHLISGCSITISSDKTKYSKRLVDTPVILVPIRPVAASHTTTPLYIFHDIGCAKKKDTPPFKHLSFPCV